MEEKEEQEEDDAASADQEMHASVSVRFCAFMACKTSRFLGSRTDTGFTSHWKRALHPGRCSHLPGEPQSNRLTHKSAEAVPSQNHGEISHSGAEQ